MKKYILILLLIILANTAKAQSNPIFITIPSLLYNVNFQTGGIGETIIASTRNSSFTVPCQNPSLLIKSDKNTGFYVSCIPELYKSRKDEFVVNIL